MNPCTRIIITPFQGFENWAYLFHRASPYADKWRPSRACMLSVIHGLNTLTSTNDHFGSIE